MKQSIALVLLLLSGLLQAQHCPWDCSGMILLKTDVTAAELRQLNPVLTDQNKNLIIDTIYGTGLDTHDSCRFLYYDDFIQYRTQKINIHHWYAFDTMYHFAEGFYLVKYNYCRYNTENSNDLFIRFNLPADDAFYYIEIPLSRRIHLHDLNPEIRQRLRFTEIPSLQPMVMEVTRQEWKLPGR